MRFSPVGSDARQRAFMIANVDVRQHDGCQALGKGVAGRDMAATSAIQRSLPSRQVGVPDVVKRALVTKRFGGKRHRMSDFCSRALNGH